MRGTGEGQGTSWNRVCCRNLIALSQGGRASAQLEEEVPETVEKMGLGRRDGENQTRTNHSHTSVCNL